MTARRPRRSALHRVLALTLAAVAVLGAGVGVSAAASTEAAWTDATHTRAVVTSGSWAPRTGHTCTAWAQGGAKIASCAVTSVRVDGWSDGSRVHRNYYVKFATPIPAEYIDFTIDLSAAVGTTPAMSWSSAVIQGDPPFTAQNGWKCSDLPVLRARTKQWQTIEPYFSVVSQRAGETVICK